MFVYTSYQIILLLHQMIGELRLTIMSSMAQDEVRKISERTKFGFKRAIEKGTVLGTGNIWGYNKDNGKLVIDREEAKLVKEIFEIYANDRRIGLKKLSAVLQEKGYYNRKRKSYPSEYAKKDYTKSQIQGILHRWTFNCNRLQE